MTKCVTYRFNGYKGNKQLEIVQRTYPTFKRSESHCVIKPERVLAVDTESGYYARYGAMWDSEKEQYISGLRTALVSVCRYSTKEKNEGIRELYAEECNKHYGEWREDTGVPREKIGHRRKGSTKLALMKQAHVYDFDEIEQEKKDSSSVEERLAAFQVWEETKGEYEHITLLHTETEEYPIIALLDYLFPLYAEREERASQTKQREKRIHTNGGYYRDGRRKTILPVCMTFYNMPYDISRLFRQNEQFLRAIQLSTQDSVRVCVGPYEIELVENRCYTATPSFEWFIRRDGYILRVIGRDLWSYDKSGLDAFSEALLGIGKDELSEEEKALLFDRCIDRSFEEKEGLEQKWKQYAAHDVRITFECLQALILALSDVSHAFVMRNGMIPRSAPGCAARIAWSLASNDEWNKPQEWVQEIGALTYAGARAFTSRPGKYDRMWVYDISSAYPHVMSLLPDLCTVQYERVKEGYYDQEQYKGKWGSLCISGRGTDKYYPALRKHDEKHGRLQYVYGDFTRLWVTIPEIVIGVASGRLEVHYVHDGVIMEGEKDKSFLRKFVLKMYDMKKRSKKDSPLYLMSKLMMNSLYGKLVEVNVDACSVAKDYELAKCLTIPIVRDKEGKHENWQETIQAYVQHGIDGLMEIQEKYADVQEHASFGMLYKLHGRQTGIAGQYYLPLYGAQITGMTSAKLGLVASLSGATNGHTDSIFVDKPIEWEIDAAMSLIEQCGYEAYNRQNGLGSFVCEIAGMPATIIRHNVYVVYKDTYDTKNVKLAKHGIVHAEKSDIVSIIEKLYEDGRVEYRTRKTPVKMKTAALRGTEPGMFIREKRRRSVTTDCNQQEEHGVLSWKEG